MTYLEFVCNYISEKKKGMPIYVAKISQALAVQFNKNEDHALAATSVAVKRVIDGNYVPELRCYQKGIYYKTAITPFGEIGINKERLIEDKYLYPDIGYETGYHVLHRMGLTSQMPRERILATNRAKDCARMDKNLGVVIRPPKVEVNAKNKKYLQILDVLELMDKAPIDVNEPYRVIAEHIYKNDLKYDFLLALADRYYGKNTVLTLARTANMGGIDI